MNPRIPLPPDLLQQLADDVISKEMNEKVETCRAQVRLAISRGHPLLGPTPFRMPKDRAIDRAIELAVEAALARQGKTAQQPSDRKKILEGMATSVVRNGTSRTLFQLQIDFRDTIKREFDGLRLPKDIVKNSLLTAIKQQRPADMRAVLEPVKFDSIESEKGAEEFAKLRAQIEKRMARLKKTASPEAERKIANRTIRLQLDQLNKRAANNVQKHAVERLKHEFDQQERLGFDPLASGQIRRVNWHILKPSEESWREVVGYYERLSQIRHEKYELERLKAIYEFGADEIFVGTESFEGYVVFCFAKANLSVLECPHLGNALYLMKRSEWKILSQLSKSELLAGDRTDVSRIIHSSSWKAELVKILRKHGLKR